MDAEGWGAQLASADPAFGAGTFLVPRLRADPRLDPAGRPAARARWEERQAAEQDAAATALARELATAELARDVLPFLLSAAGRALVDAEVKELVLYPWQSGDYYARSVDRFGDPQRVGDAARAEFAAVAAGARGAAVPSPHALANTMAAAAVEPEHARAIAAFAATPAGQRWLAVRRRAFVRSEPRFLALFRAAEAAGFAVPHDDAAAKLPEYLPRTDSSGR